jgi:hypothetical protein
VELVKRNVGLRVSIEPPFGDSPVGAVALMVEPSALTKVNVAGVTAPGDNGVRGASLQRAIAVAHTSDNTNKVFLCIERALLIQAAAGVT